MGHLLGLGITRGEKDQILRSCGPGDTDHHAVITKMLVAHGPGREQLLAPQPGLRGRISGVCAGSHGRLELGPLGWEGVEKGGWAFKSIGSRRSRQGRGKEQPAS